MSETRKAHTPEPWLRGPVDGIEPWLQPVAHALVQVREDVARAVSGLPQAALAARPGARLRSRFTCATSPAASTGS